MRLGVTLRSFEVRERGEFERAFNAMAEARTDVLVVAQDPLLFSARTEVILHAARRLPAVYGNREFADGGGLMSYGPNIAHQWRRAASFVDKILRGAKPGDLPVEQPTKFGLLLNLRTAKAPGITIPPSLLQRADEVIE